MAGNRMVLRRALRVVLLGLAISSIALFGCIGRVSAQVQAAPLLAQAPSDAPPEVSTTGAPAEAGSPVDVFDGVATESAPDSTANSSNTLANGAVPGLLGMIRESMRGDHKELWRPLSLSTFFSDGWLDPWYTYPRSSTGAPRQAWINATDGVFYRLWFAQFSYVNNAARNENAYLGEYAIFTPISQRFQFLFIVPFVESNKGGYSNTYHSNFVDFAVSPRFLLSESQDFSQVAECVVRTPTGNTENGNGQATLTPEYEFWYGGLPGAAVIRGSTGATIPTNSAGLPTTVAGMPVTVPGSRTTVNYNLSIGKYWTPHDATLGDLVTLLSVNGYTTVDDRGPRYSYLSLTPGFRFHLTNDYYSTAGIEVPVTGPKSQSFTYSPIFWLVKVWLHGEIQEVSISLLMVRRAHLPDDLATRIEKNEARNSVGRHLHQESLPAV